MKTETLTIKVTADLSEFPVIVKTAERDALYEAVEVLEDMHAADLAVNAQLQRRNDNQYGIITQLDAETDRLTDERDDYRDRLRGSNEDYRKLQATASYRLENLTRLRERIKTYRTTLKNMADHPNVYGAGARLASFVLSSRIEDGGSDF